MFETPGINQGGEHFHLAGRQQHSDEAVGDGGLCVDKDAQFIEHHAGLVRELFGNGLLF